MLPITICKQFWYVIKQVEVWAVIWYYVYTTSIVKYCLLKFRQYTKWLDLPWEMTNKNNPRKRGRMYCLERWIKIWTSSYPSPNLSRGSRGTRPSSNSYNATSNCTRSLATKYWKNNHQILKMLHLKTFLSKCRLETILDLNTKKLIVVNLMRYYNEIPE